MAQNTIVLKGKLGRRYEEARVVGTPKPGYLGCPAEGADAGKIKVHPTAGGTAVEKIFFVEDDFQGKTIDDAYAAGDVGRYVFAETGDVINVVLTESQTITKGEKLESAGNGKLRTLASGEAIAVAEEDVTTGSGEEDFCPARIL